MYSAHNSRTQNPIAAVCHIYTEKKACNCLRMKDEEERTPRIVIFFSHCLTS